MNLHTLFAIAVQRAPDHPAIQFATEGSRVIYSYHDLFAAADGLAAGMAERGVTQGDRVVFFLGNIPEFVIAYLAVIRLGAIMVPINLRYRTLEISHIVADCEPVLIITEREHLAILTDAGCGPGGTIPLLLADEMASWQSETSPAATLVRGDDLAMIMYTSGTTGRSKGAMLSHSNLLATVTGLLAAWAWEAGDRLLLVLPLFHVHGLIVGLHCALAVGATVLLRTKFEAERTLHELCSGEATLFFAVPTVYVRLVDELRSLAGSPALQRMRLFCSGSAPLATETFAAFADLTGHTILERYGMTETGMNLSNPYVGPRLAGSVGLPLPGVFMRIVDNQYVDVPVGAEGELLVRGSNVFSGYWNAPEKTVESFCHDDLGRQWFRTGDLARQDKTTGYVTLLGRRHELIISGGFNIYPREIEEVLGTFPGVLEAAVIGVAHAEWGEVPVAYLVCSEAVVDGELHEYCRRLLASFKVPKQFHRVDALPRNAMGKLLKHMLK